MGPSRMSRVYRIRQLPLHLKDRGDTAQLLARIAPILGTTDNIRVQSLAQGNKDSQTATLIFRDLPAIFDNDEEQWTLEAKDVCGRNIIVDTHFRDFTVLNKPRDSPFTAECIAISGLASHPFGSWKHRGSGSDFMWLRDQLPEDLPYLRSLIYGYDTKLFKSHSFQDLDDIARSFIASLKQLRRSLPPAQSLFFLAHSLGGIVLKRALVLLASDGNDEEKAILQSVKGIVFFGVPHRGMEISHFLAMAAKQPNEDLISNTLSPDSALLPELDEDFSTISTSLGQNISFVYETLESQLTEKNGNGTWVRSQTSYANLVSKESAVPANTLARQTIAVNEDHSNMVKFGEDNSAYRTILSFMWDISTSTDSQANGRSNSDYSRALHISPPATSDPVAGYSVNSALSPPAGTRTKVLSNVPFPQDPSFVGRKDILEQLESEFRDPTSGSWASLHGLGGIGKSQIAIEYSYRQKKRCPQSSTFWIHASSKARFEQSFTEIATIAELPGRGDGKADTLQMVSNWLVDKDNGPWLLILDNADDASVLLESIPNDTGTEAMLVERCLLGFLPRVQHGAVLITTRDRSCALSLTGFRGTPIEVLSMSSDESIKLLRVYLPNAPQEEASELVKEMEYVPLAISQASSYIKEVSNVPISRYLSIFRRSDKDQVALLNKNKKDLRRDPGVPNAVITSWELSFRQIRANFPASADLLSLMSYFHRQAIPKFLIQRNGDDELSFEENINVLLSFSLIRAEVREETYEIHRLVQKAMQHWLYSEGHDELWKERAIQRVAHQFPDQNQNQHWPVCETLMSHVDEVLHYRTTSKESDLQRAHILSSTAVYLIERKGNAGLAEQRSTEALQIQKKYFHDDSVEVLPTMGILAYAQRELLKYEDALGLGKHILKQKLKSGGMEDENSLAAMHNLALTHAELGHFDEAEDLLKHVFEARERVLGLEIPEYLATEDGLAYVYIRQGKFEEADKLAIRLVDTCSRIFGFEHLRTLVGMELLSTACLRQNKLEAAENVMVKVIPFFTKTFGPSHWQTLNARSVLAEIYYHDERFDEAKEICLSCLDIAQEIYGPHHDATLGLKSILGWVFLKQGNFTDALRLLTEVMESDTKVVGPDHPTTLMRGYNLALCYHDMGRRDQAIRLMTEVLEKRRRILRENHPDTTASARMLATWKAEVMEIEEEESEGRDTEEEASEEEEWEEAESEVWETEEDGSEKGGERGRGKRRRLI